jgi:hypothetical protein
MMIIFQPLLIVDSRYGDRLRHDHQMFQFRIGFYHDGTRLEQQTKKG